jgi:hypothetical protein
MKHWNCHEHRDELKVSEFCSVYHPEHGQLCVFEKHWDVVLSYPIQFKDKAAAHKWVREGYIAELQEGLGTLMVGFTKDCMKERAR